MSIDYSPGNARRDASPEAAEKEVLAGHARLNVPSKIIGWGLDPCVDKFASSVQAEAAKWIDALGIPGNADRTRIAERRISDDTISILVIPKDEHGHVIPPWQELHGEFLELGRDRNRPPETVPGKQVMEALGYIWKHPEYMGRPVGIAYLFDRPVSSAESIDSLAPKEVTVIWSRQAFGEACGHLMDAFSSLSNLPETKPDVHKAELQALKYRNREGAPARAIEKPHRTDTRAISLETMRDQGHCYLGGLVAAKGFERVREEAIEGASTRNAAIAGIRMQSDDTLAVTFRLSSGGVSQEAELFIACYEPQKLTMWWSDRKPDWEDLSGPAEVGV